MGWDRTRDGLGRDAGTTTEPRRDEKMGNERMGQERGRDETDNTIQTWTRGTSMNEPEKPDEKPGTRPTRRDEKMDGESDKVMGNERRGGEGELEERARTS